MAGLREAIASGTLAALVAAFEEAQARGRAVA
jgi:hypothetical protein